MPNKCALCGRYPDHMEATFANKSKTIKVTQDNIHEWRIAFRVELHLGDRLCRLHFDKDEEPFMDPVTRGEFDAHRVVRKSRRGRKFRFGTHRPTFNPTEAELALAAKVATLNNQLKDTKATLKVANQQITTIKDNVRKILFSDGCQRMLIDYDVFNLLREKYLFSSGDPPAFNITSYQQRDKDIRHFTSAPSYPALLAVARYMEDHYRKLFTGTTRPHSVDTVNALSMMLMKCRTNLPYDFIGALFLLGETWVISITHHMLEGFVELLSPFYLTLPTLDELKLHQVKRSTTDTDWERRLGGIDQTYLYLQHSSDYFIQTETFSGHHYTNELQFLEFVFPDGCTFAMFGAFSVQNDNWHLQKFINTTYNGVVVRDWLVRIGQALNKGILEVDRGFRYAYLQMPPEIEVRMPAFLSGREFFSAEEALMSEKSASARAGVEQHNSRLNIQDIIADKYPNKALRHARFWMYAAAIISRIWYKPFYRSIHYNDPPPLHFPPTRPTQQQPQQSTTSRQQRPRRAAQQHLQQQIQQHLHNTQLSSEEQDALISLQSLFE